MTLLYAIKTKTTEVSMGSMDVDKNNAAKRTQAFLENCAKSKTRKVDLEDHLAQKKAEKRWHEDCVVDMKTDIKKRVQKLKATELVIDNLTQDIEAVEQALQYSSE